MIAENKEQLSLLESVGSKLPGAFKENVINKVEWYAEEKDKAKLVDYNIADIHMLLLHS